ncbi:MAG: ribosome maturation factor RimM [Gammaproteobacteria bacterium]|nr:ribosome maturation factor RimM [Gammaproteobacteria bacterium]
MADLIEVGRIGGVHGLRGWVRLSSFTEPRSALFEYRHYQGVSPHSGSQSLELAESRFQEPRLLARFEGVQDRDAAAELMDTVLYIERSQLPALGAGEYYWDQLIGLRVVTQTGVELGQVTDMLETGANDVLVVRGERERLIPYVMGVTVTEVEVASGQMVVDWDPEY